MVVEETLEEGVEVGLVGVAEGVGDAVGRGPVYFSPSSPGEKTTTEQNPSVDVMSNVLPSGDLKYGELTIQSICKWVGVDTNHVRSVKAA